MNIKNITKLLLFIVTLTLCNNVLCHKAVAIDKFFNGVPTIEKDLNAPQDNLFGGSNVAVTPAPVNSTNLTVTTEKLTRNTLHSIFGGNLTTHGSNSINGNVTLTINNTDTQQIVGGSKSRSSANIAGSIFLNVTNSTAQVSISGGSTFDTNPNLNVADVNGSIHMNLIGVTTPLIFGVGTTFAPFPNNIAVGGDVNINLKNSWVTGALFATSNTGNTHVRGNVTIDTMDSTINSIFGTVNSDIMGNLTINIGKGTHVTGDITVTNSGTIFGETNINLESATVDGRITLGPTGDSTLGKVTATILNSTVNTITCGPGGIQPATLTNGTVIINDSKVNLLQLGSEDGTTVSATGTIEGGIVNTVKIGSEQRTGQVGTAALNIIGGDITTIITGFADNSIITFTPKKESIVRTSIDGPGLVNMVNIEKGARTLWGNPGSTFSLKTKDFTMSGELTIPPGAVDTLTILGNFTANGGILIPEGLTAQTTVSALQLVGGPYSTLMINKSLTIMLSFSPELLGATHDIPIVTTTAEFAKAPLFTKKNTKGLIWSDLKFDEASRTWFLTNIRPSDDFYVFSVVRESSNWLMHQYTGNIQRRANHVLGNGCDGLWIDVQGGYEKIDTAIGKAKMPWGMASMGYDHIIKESEEACIKGLYGFGFGFGLGDNKWHTMNTARNDIMVGMLAGYLGLMHNTGLYGTATLQLTSNKVKIKCSGFTSDYKWREVIPTEAVELGWQHTFKSGFTLNPRGQIILGQLSKHHFKLPYENDTVTLNKTFLTTTIVGLAGEYEFHLGMPVSLQASVDWIKGVAGDFSANSNLLKKRFEYKNDTSAVRSSLGFNSQITEQFCIQCKAFADAGKDKGLGGQLRASYNF